MDKKRKKTAKRVKRAQVSYGYDSEIASIICERISGGRSLLDICTDKDMPTRRTVYSWLRDNADFQEQYRIAREMQADTLFDEILQIADDARNDWMEVHGKDDIGWKANQEHVQRSRLRIDSRKWAAGKLAPKKYGERLETHLSGSVEIKRESPTDAELEQFIASGGRTGITFEAQSEEDI